MPSPDSAAQGWEHFPHVADMGVRGWGTTIEQAFEQAALALTAIVTHVPIREQSRVEIIREAPDRELLLVEWLNAIIFEMATRNMLFGRFSVSIDGTTLRGAMWGEAVDVKRHAPACEPKGATLTALRVEREGDGRWTAACVIDV